MLPAANRPILEYVFDALVEAGITRIVTVVGYKHDRVQNHFGPTYRDVPIEYVMQDKQLGSGHALLQARDAVEGPPLVVNGDRLIDAEAVGAVIDHFESEPAHPALSVVERPDAAQYGAVDLQDGDLVTIVEKPDSDDFRLINGGIYAFPDSIFDSIDQTPRNDGELALTDTISRSIERGRVRAVKTDGMWVDATYPWDLLTVAREVLARGRVVEQATEEGVWVAESATVHPDATLQAPVTVGPDCEVGAGAVLGPQTALGENVTVGANATVQHSVLDVDTRVDAGSTLIEAVTGQDVTLGANTVIPGGPADVQVGTDVYEDQRLGAVLADRVTARGNVSLSPGSLVGPAATLHSGVHVFGHVPADAEVVR
jgi:glucose-1-phosphate thymidylyltransferase